MTEALSYGGPQPKCSCGVFNPARAKRILEDARNKAT